MAKSRVQPKIDPEYLASMIAWRTSTAHMTQERAQRFGWFMMAAKDLGVLGDAERKEDD